MKPAIREYIRRTLDVVGKRDPFKVMRSSPAALERLVKGLSRERARKRPAPGKWSINEIVAHLSETEIVYGYRLREIASKNGIVIAGMDQNAWARGGNYNRRGLRRSLEHYRALRKSNVDFLESLPRKKWKNYGRHAERGRESIERIVYLLAGHDINHRKQIEAIKKNFQKR